MKAGATFSEILIVHDLLVQYEVVADVRPEQRDKECFLTLVGGPDVTAALASLSRKKWVEVFFAGLATEKWKPFLMVLREV